LCRQSALLRNRDETDLVSPSHPNRRRSEPPRVADSGASSG
jgi:hypothetical protein